MIKKLAMTAALLFGTTAMAVADPIMERSCMTLEEANEQFRTERYQVNILGIYTDDGKAAGPTLLGLRDLEEDKILLFVNDKEEACLVWIGNRLIR